MKVAIKECLRLTLIEKAIDASNYIVAIIILLLDATLGLFSSSVFIYDTKERSTFGWVGGCLSWAPIIACP
jgi:hypothetical protein